MANKKTAEKKVSLEYKPPEFAVATFGETNFKVKKLLSVQEQLALINIYIQDYFSTEENSKKFINTEPYNYLEAEYNLKGYILQLATNIDAGSVYEDLYSDTNFWDTVLSKIENYSEFRQNLMTIVNEIERDKEQKQSLGNTLGELLSVLQNIIDQLENLSPEKIEELKKVGEELVAQISEVQKAE